MAIQVNPIVARKGRYMESFTMKETDAMMEFMERAEQMIRDAGIKGQIIVYTKIPQWSASRKFDMYQVFKIPESLLTPGDKKISPQYKLKGLFHNLTLRQLRKPCTDRAERIIFTQLTAARLISSIHSADRLRDTDHFFRGFQLHFHIPDRFTVFTASLASVFERNPSVTVRVVTFVAEHHAFHVEHDRGGFIVHADKVIHDPFQLGTVQVPGFRIGYGCVRPVSCYNLGGTLPGDLVGVSYRLYGCSFRVKLEHGTVAGFKFFTHTMSANTFSKLQSSK